MRCFVVLCFILPCLIFLSTSEHFASDVLQNIPADTNANLDQLSFRDKMKFFEKEIKDHSDKQPAKGTPGLLCDQLRW